MKSLNKLVWNQETQSACRAAVLEDKLKNLSIESWLWELGDGSEKGDQRIRQWQSKRAENCLLGENLLRYIVYWWSEEESLNVSTRNQENMLSSTEVTESRTIESLTRHVKSCRSNSIVLGLKTGIIRVLQRKYSKAGDNLMSKPLINLWFLRTWNGSVLSCSNIH